MGESIPPSGGIEEESGVRPWEKEQIAVGGFPGARRLLGSSRGSCGRPGCSDRKIGCSVRKTTVGNKPPLRSGDKFKWCLPVNDGIVILLLRLYNMPMTSCTVELKCYSQGVRVIFDNCIILWSSLSAILRGDRIQ